MRSIKSALATTAIVALGVAGIAGYGSMSKAADKFKVGWIYLGPVTDGGWNSAHYAGQQAVEKEFGDKVETMKVENVPESADAERVETQLAQQGRPADFRHLVRLHGPNAEDGQGVPKGQVRALLRVQDRG